LILDFDADEDMVPTGQEYQGRALREAARARYGGLYEMPTDEDLGYPTLPSP